MGLSIGLNLGLALVGNSQEIFILKTILKIVLGLHCVTWADFHVEDIIKIIFMTNSLFWIVPLSLGLVDPLLDGLLPLLLVPLDLKQDILLLQNRCANKKRLSGPPWPGTCWPRTWRCLHQWGGGSARARSLARRHGARPFPSSPPSWFVASFRLKGCKTIIIDKYNYKVWQKYFSW